MPWLKEEYVETAEDRIEFEELRIRGAIEHLVRGETAGDPTLGQVIDATLQTYTMELARLSAQMKVVQEGFKNIGS